MTLFPIIALISAAFFTSAAGYITFVEHPARLHLPDVPLLAQWQPSYKRAFPVQSGLAIIGGTCGLASWQISGGWFWLAGSLILLANWPFTLIAIMPINKQLKSIRPDRADAKSRRLLVAWGRLHDVRSMLGAGATVMFGAGLAFYC